MLSLAIQWTSLRNILNKYVPAVNTKKEIHPRSWKINLIDPREEIGYKPTSLAESKYKRGSH